MPETNSIKSDEFISVARGQAVVEARQSAEGECRILSAAANVTTSVSEVFTGEVRYTGKVRFDCLILTGGRTECVSAVAEFSDKIASSSIVGGMKIMLSPEVINCEATSDGGAIKLVAVIDTDALAVAHHGCDCISDTGDGIYSENSEIGYCSVIAEQSETVYVTDSITVKPCEIVCVTSKAVVTAVDVGDGDVKISGAVYSNVITRADDLIASNRIVTPFVKSAAALGADPACTAYADVCAVDSVAAINDEGKLELSVTLAIDAVVFAHRTAQTVTDVFCADSVLETETSEILCCSVEPQQTVTDAVDGQVTLAPERLAADNVLCVANTVCSIGDVRIDGGKVNVEGLVGGDVVYYNAEKNAVDTLSFRLPFSMPLSLHTDATEVRARATVTDVTVKIRRESVFDIKAEVAFTVRASSCKTVPAVVSVVRGEAIPAPDATVIVHIAKPGETLWQAAKALCCSPERVAEQNDCQAPFAGGERLVNFCIK